MASFKAAKPPANPPICFHCDERLFGAGRFYETVSIEGIPRNVHATCAREILEARKRVDSR